MASICPHCGASVGEPWHRGYGLQKIEKGWVEVGVPVVGRINIKRENLAMVYFCEASRLPFLLVLRAVR